MKLGHKIEIGGTEIEIVGYINGGNAVRGANAYRIMMDNKLHYISSQFLDLLMSKSSADVEWKKLYFEVKKESEKKDKIIFDLTNKLLEAQS